MRGLLALSLSVGVVDRFGRLLVDFRLRRRSAQVVNPFGHERCLGVVGLSVLDSCVLCGGLCAASCAAAFVLRCFHLLFSLVSPCDHFRRTLDLCR